MKAFPVALLALSLVVAGASACSDSDSSGSGPRGGAGTGGTGNVGAATSEGGSSTSAAGEEGAPASGGAGGAPGVPTSEEFCEGFADALCRWAEECNGFENCEDWRGYTLYVQECADALASEAGGFVSFDADTAVECLEVANGYSCDGGPLFARAPVREGCAGVFVGTVQPDGECTSADFALVFDECDSGYCDRNQGNQSCLGVCVAYKQEDESCSVSDRCASGLSCNDGTCGPPRGPGADCESASCASGLNCAGDPPTCRQLGQAGATCVDNYDCERPASCVDDQCSTDLDVGESCQDTEACQEGLYCRSNDQSSPVCASPVAAAAACNIDYDLCEDGYGCSYVEPYVCVPAQGALNEPCGPQGCEGDLWCDYTAPFTGTCRARVPLSGDCLDDRACVDGLYCVGLAGKCGPTGGDGDPCSAFEPDSCEEGLFCRRDTGACGAPRTEEQTCNPSQPLASCQAGLYCACLSQLCPSITSGHEPADVCKAQLANGLDCTSTQECLSGYCIANKCAEEPPAPENCSR